MKILFVGNSYTYYNDLPAILERLIRDQGQEAQVFSVTKGGWKLHRYLDLQDENAAKFEQAMENAPFDVVFLQEQSLNPLLDYEQFADGVKRVAERVGAKRTVLYQTWGRKEGHAALEEHGWTRKEMTEGLAEAYQKAAAAIGAEVSPVGTRFWEVGQMMPEQELYDPDRTHPSYAGSCLAAMTHYKALFGAVPENLSSLQLSEEVLALYKKMI
ncbi:MAG: hypothetical protein IJC46_00370 [Clostridia bacterium]|nr:hypothetical protein [Clostridia bacterium]